MKLSEEEISSRASTNKAISISHIIAHIYPVASNERGQPLPVPPRYSSNESALKYI